MPTETPTASPLSISISSVEQRLSQVIVNPDVHVKLASLGKATIGGVEVEFSAAEIGQQVRAHVHRLGDEVYIILKGIGRIHTGKVDFIDGAPGPIHWEEPVEVGPGTVFNIPAGYAHSLENVGPDPLTMVFIGAPTDLTTDRGLLENPPKR